MVSQLWLLPVLLVVLSETKTVECGNILLIMPIPSPSHFVWHKVLIHELAAKGHNVTVLSTDVEEKDPPNVHYLYMDGAYELMQSDDSDFDVLEMSKMSPLKSLVVFSFFGPMISEVLVKSSGFQKLLTYPRDFKWDLIINDHVGGSAVLGIVGYFNYPPLISATAFFIPAITSDYVHKYYAYVPHFILRYSSDMTFCERIHNVFIHSVEDLIYHYYTLPQMDKIARKAVGVDIKYLGEIAQDTLLSLINANPSINIVEPMPPNVISVGGLQITKPKPLDSDIDEFLNKSKKGGILFSLGTNMQSHLLGDERIGIILDTMRQIPDYNFIWKFEADALPVAQPKNVMIKKWLRQNDILAHNKTKLFVTHCGMLSTQESTWYGVPMVGIPCFADQHVNLAQSVAAGVAEGVSLHEMTTIDLKDAIMKVLENPIYRENSQIRSQSFQDQPQSPLDRAIWWIEYVMRNPKADHLRLPTSKLGTFRANCYDIILFVVVLINVFVIMLIKLVKFFLTKKKRKNSSKKTN